MFGGVITSKTEQLQDTFHLFLIGILPVVLWWKNNRGALIVEKCH